MNYYFFLKNENVVKIEDIVVIEKSQQDSLESDCVVIFVRILGNEGKELCYPGEFNDIFLDYIPGFTTKLHGTSNNLLAILPYEIQRKCFVLKKDSENSYIATAIANTKETY